MYERFAPRQQSADRHRHRDSVQTDSEMGSCNTFAAALLLFLSRAGVDGGGAPNIVVIVADDLGWNDVGFHGSNQGGNSIETFLA